MLSNQYVAEEKPYYTVFLATTSFSYSTFFKLFPCFSKYERYLNFLSVVFLKTLENIGRNHIVLRLVKFLLSKNLLHLNFPSIDIRYERVTAESLRNLQSYEKSVSQYRVLKYTFLCV